VTDLARACDRSEEYEREPVFHVWNRRLVRGSEAVREHTGFWRKMGGRADWPRWRESAGPRCALSMTTRARADSELLAIRNASAAVRHRGAAFHIRTFHPDE